MKFKNFDIADVFGPNDTEQAKGYIGKLGYFEDTLDELEDAIKSSEKTYILDHIRSNRKYCFSNICYYKYFLPLEKVKKKEPAEKKLKWRPCKDIEELEDLLNCDVLAFVGRVLEIKDKISGATIIVGITGTEELPIDSGSIYSIFLGNGQVYSFGDLFDKFEINVNDEWQPFGVKR